MAVSDTVFVFHHTILTHSLELCILFHSHHTITGLFPDVHNILFPFHHKIVAFSFHALTSLLAHAIIVTLSDEILFNSHHKIFPYTLPNISLLDESQLLGFCVSVFPIVLFTINGFGVTYTDPHVTYILCTSVA